MIIIFILSTPPFSGKRTKKITDKLSTEIDFSLIAHVIVYFILGFLASGAIKSNFNLKNRLIITVIICILYAASDELHQYFEPERKGRMFDMIIDIIGALFGILFYSTVYLKLLSKDKSANL